MRNNITTPLTSATITRLRAGEEYLLSGEIFTARDQAHKKLAELIQKKKKLPIDLATAIIYYCGPTPEKPSEIIGSCGPTTSSRMDLFTPLLMKHGLRMMIGKGKRSQDVIHAIKQCQGAYAITYGGCGAYLQEKVIAREVIAFPELGPEAIYKLTVRDFPLIIAVDSKGNSCINH